MDFSPGSNRVNLSLISIRAQFSGVCMVAVCSMYFICVCVGGGGVLMGINGLLN